MFSLGLLWANAVLYAGFSIWCTVSPRETMRFLSLSDTASAGMSEFMAVYGGLQAGLSAFFTIAAISPAYHRIGVIASLSIYAGVVCWRSIALLTLATPMRGGVLMVFGLEIALLLWSIAAFFADRR